MLRQVPAPILAFLGRPQKTDLARFADWCVGTRELASSEERADLEGRDNRPSNGGFMAGTLSALCFDSHDALGRMTGFA